MRKKIESGSDLLAWRTKLGLSQIQAANIFCRCLRAYQNVEWGKLKKFPSDIDKLARLYESNHNYKVRRCLD